MLMSDILRHAMKQHVSNLYIRLYDKFYTIPMDDTDIYSIAAELLDYLSASTLPKCICDFGIIGSEYLTSMHPDRFAQELTKPDSIPVLTRDNYPNTRIHYGAYIAHNDSVLHDTCVISGHMTSDEIQIYAQACERANHAPWGYVHIKGFYPTLSDTSVDAVDAESFVETLHDAVTQHWNRISDDD